MAIRTNEHGVRLGSEADAGALAKTARAPQGVKPGSYQRLSAQAGAPGPYVAPGTDYPSRNPETGTLEYDLDAVERWNANRKGPGSFWKEPERRTPMRAEVLTAIGAGRMSVTVQNMKAGLTLDGKPWSGRAETRVFNDFKRGGYIVTPEEVGPVRLSDTGAKLLEKWQAEAAEPEPAQR